MRFTCLAPYVTFAAYAAPLLRTISVDGHGTLEAIADRAIVHVSLQNVAATPPDARSGLDVGIQEVLDVMNSFPGHELVSGGFRTEKVYNWIGGKQVQEGTRCTQLMRIKMSDTEKLGDLLQALASMQSGVIEISDVQLKASNEEEFEQTVLQKAYDDALRKAQSISNEANVSLGYPRSISTISTDAPRLSRASSLSNVWTDPQLTFEATLYVTFDLAPKMVPRERPHISSPSVNS